MTTSEVTALDLEQEPGPLERLLGIFGDVRGGEAGTVLLLLLNVFLILGGYQVCKVAREPLILATGGAEVKSYAAAGQAVVLMFFIPLYSWFASKVDRARLIFGVTLFFIVNIELFWLGARLGIPYLGVAFFIWVGIFNNAIIAQFWSYGNDLYTREVGERLFPVIGIGATLGSPFGTAAAAWLFHNKVGAYTILQITAVVLFLSLGIYWLVERREGQRRRRPGTGEKLKEGPGGFALLAESPYLRLDLHTHLSVESGEYNGQLCARQIHSCRSSEPGGRRSFLQQGGIHWQLLWQYSVLGERCRSSHSRSAGIPNREVPWAGGRPSGVADDSVGLVCDRRCRSDAGVGSIRQDG